MSNKDCPLCDLERKTRWHYEDETFIICDCETCKIPMVVIRKHIRQPSDVLESFAYGLVTGVFASKKISFRIKQKKVLDHWHKHILLEEAKK